MIPRSFPTQRSGGWSSPRMAANSLYGDDFFHPVTLGPSDSLNSRSMLQQKKF
jgi:hypothetical protein